MAASSRSSPAIKQRPKFLNVAAIRLPLAAFVSILHRISGFVLFLSLPALLGLLGLSLRSPEGFAEAGRIAGHPLVGLALFGLTWAYLHHFCAGIRFLLLDMHVGLDKRGAYRSSVAVLAVSLTLTLIVALRVTGVF